MSTKRSPSGSRGRRRGRGAGVGSARRIGASLAASLAASFTLGCGIAGEGEPIELSGPPPMVVLAHAHGDSGPHGGRLIELGHDHEFHAELIVERFGERFGERNCERPGGESDRVRLIALDRSLERLPFEIDRVALCTYAQGVAKTFEMASLTGGEYVSTDAALVAVLSAGDAVSCKVRLTIADKHYTGVFAYEKRSTGEVANDNPPAGVGDVHTSRRPGKDTAY